MEKRDIYNSLSLVTKSFMAISMLNWFLLLISVSMSLFPSDMAATLTPFGRILLSYSTVFFTPFTYDMLFRPQKMEWRWHSMQGVICVVPFFLFHLISDNNSTMSFGWVICIVGIISIKTDRSRRS